MTRKIKFLWMVALLLLPSLGKSQSKTAFFSIQVDLSINLSNQSKVADIQKIILKKRKKIGYDLRDEQIKKILLYSGNNRLNCFTNFRHTTIADEVLFTTKQIKNEVVIDSLKRTFFPDKEEDSLEIKERDGKTYLVQHLVLVFEDKYKKEQVSELVHRNWMIDLSYGCAIDDELKPELFSDVVVHDAKNEKFVFSASKFQNISKNSPSFNGVWILNQ